MAEVTLGLLLVLMLLASVTTFHVSRRWYVPLALVWTLAFLLFGYRMGLSREEMALGSWLTGLAWGLGCIAVISLAMAAGVAIPRLHPLFADERVMGTTGAQVAHKSLVEVPLGTVLLEEVVFRSVLLGSDHEACTAPSVTGVLVVRRSCSGSGTSCPPSRCTTRTR